MTNVDVRRLHGILSDYEEYAKKAKEEMDTWLENEEDDITYQEATSRLSYYLAQLGVKYE